MNKHTIQCIRSFTAIFWLGLFMAISFLEAPLKFTAPGLSLAEGLQIGKIVFGALNKCEWALLLIIGVTCLFKGPSKKETNLILLLCVITLLESVWLLPMLDAGASRVINGQPAGEHTEHWVFIVFEVIKIPVLLLIGLEINSGRKITKLQTSAAYNNIKL
jgi:hypothetical protein